MARKLEESGYWWIGGGCAAGAALLGTAGSDVVIPPLLGFIVWGCACGAVIRGMIVLRWRRWLVVCLSLLAAYVAFSFWRLMSPRGRIEIVDVRQIPKSSSLDSIVGISMTFKNSGKSPVTYRSPAYVSEMLFVQDGQIRVFRPNEDRLHARMVLEPGRGEEDLLLRPGETTSANLLMSVPLDDRVAYDRAKAMVLWMVQVRYQDWWPTQQVTELCQYIPVGGQRPTCAKYNGPSE